MDFIVEVLQGVAEQIIPVLGEALQVLLLGGLLWISRWAAEFVKGHGIDVKIKNQERLARAAVEAVDRKYKELDGPAKKDKAIDFLVESLQEKGIPITDSDLDMFIEQAVETVRKGFEEQYTADTQVNVIEEQVINKDTKE